jgi:hypothetical protein
MYRNIFIQQETRNANGYNVKQMLIEERFGKRQVESISLAAILRTEDYAVWVLKNFKGSLQIQ